MGSWRMTILFLANTYLNRCEAQLLDQEPENPPRAANAEHGLHQVHQSS
jgi:hypothetical protein